jgi:ABC-2 type transport system permease protein/fluoroquinolone transport system permease protein
MKSGILTLFRQDIVLTWRNGLVLVTVITLAVIVALYWTLPFMLKEDAPLSQSQILLDMSEGQVVSAFFQGEGMDMAANREELESAIQEQAGTIGIVVQGSRDALAYELVFRNRPSDETISIVKAVFSNVTASLRGEEPLRNINVRYLRAQADPITTRESLVLIMLAFEVLILGFLFIAVVVFGEKREGSIKAYRVSPSGLANYVISKTLVFTLLSVAYGIVMVITTIGFGADFASLSLVLLVSCSLMTLLGLGVAVFFENLSQWFVPGVLLLSINMLAIIPFQIPTYSLPGLGILPGYNVIFAAREILFPTGKEAFLGPVMLRLAIGTALCGGFAAWAVRRKMLREGS